MNEFDWVSDTASGKTVLAAPWFMDLGIWFDVPQPIVPEGLKQEKPSMPDQIIPWTIHRRELICEMLRKRVNGES